jgi:putative integral membrane protein (TIGR02587 family)
VAHSLLTCGSTSSAKVLTLTSQTSASKNQRPVSKFNSELNRHFLIGLARAYAGAILFALPMLMTMEMWSLGFSLDRLQLVVLLLVTLPLLVGLSHFVGFEPTFELKEDLVDALVAYAVGFSASAVVLLLLSIIDATMSLDEVVGKVAIQAVPAAIGALLAQSQLGQRTNDEEDENEPGYFGTLFLMAVGALFLALNLAPTEEIILIAFRLSPWHALAIALVSVVIMHGFVYAVDFSGEAEIPMGAPLWRVFLRYTVVGYAQALLISLFVLWVFGRTEGLDISKIIVVALVLGLPAAVGSAAARLIL